MVEWAVIVFCFLGVLGSTLLRLLHFAYWNPLLLEYLMMYKNPRRKGKLHCILLCFWGLSGSSSLLPSSPFQLWPLTWAQTSFNMTSCCSSSQEQLIEPRVTHWYSSGDACTHTFESPEEGYCYRKQTQFSCIFICIFIPWLTCKMYLSVSGSDQ